MNIYWIPVNILEPYWSQVEPLEPDRYIELVVASTTTFINSVPNFPFQDKTLISFLSPFCFANNNLFMLNENKTLENQDGD